MAKRRHWMGPIPSDENRCTRNDGKNWRCYAPRSPNSIFCTKHHLNYLSKLRSKPPSSSPSSSILSNPKPPDILKTLTLKPGEIWALSSSNPKSNKPKTCHHHDFHYFRVDRTLPILLATPLLPHPVLPEEIQFASRHPPSCGTFRPAPSGPKPVSASAFAFQMFGVKTVTWMRIPFYRIFPNKGEVWVLDGGAMAEVLSDFVEEEGVTVAEVEGRGDGVYGRSSEERVFGRREMVLFLRRVEVERVEGGDGHGEQRHLWKVMA